MELKEKKQHIIRCIKLGMSLFKAQLISECTDEEITILNNDEIFLNRIEQQYAIEEYALLLKHNSAIEIARDKGNANPIQWRLAKLNPDDWDSKDKTIKLETPQAIQVNLKGRHVTSDD